MTSVYFHVNIAQFIEPEVLTRPCHWSQNYSLLSTFSPSLEMVPKILQYLIHVLRIKIYLD